MKSAARLYVLASGSAENFEGKALVELSIMMHILEIQ